jgi:hypothetical protein
MSDSDYESGSAFPISLPYGNGYQEGMSLRDYFAAQALAGRLSDGTSRNFAFVATEAYMYADAMLVAREI